MRWAKLIKGRQGIDYVNFFYHITVIIGHIVMGNNML